MLRSPCCAMPTPRCIWRNSVAVGEAVEAGAALTNDPNVGGFGQIDAEVVLQNPVRIYGLLAFFAAVALAQIMLVLKKRQVEKVQAAEGI